MNNNPSWMYASTPYILYQNTQNSYYHASSFLSPNSTPTFILSPSSPTIYVSSPDYNNLSSPNYNHNQIFRQQISYAPENLQKRLPFDATIKEIKIAVEKLKDIYYKADDMSKLQKDLMDDNSQLRTKILHSRSKFDLIICQRRTDMIENVLNKVKKLYASHNIKDENYVRGRIRW
eukprot:UN23535